MENPHNSLLKYKVKGMCFCEARLGADASPMSVSNLVCMNVHTFPFFRSDCINYAVILREQSSPEKSDILNTVTALCSIPLRFWSKSPVPHQYQPNSHGAGATKIKGG